MSLQTPTQMNGSASTARTKEYVWRPQAGPQAALVKCPIDEIFYGGARGGGKTDGMLGKFGVKARRYGKNAVGIFFRRTREDLREAIERSRQIYGRLGEWKDQPKEWRFHNGARLKFSYLDRDQDADNYQGHSYTDVFFEELTHWADAKPVNKLRATLRSAANVPCQFHATGNPGGPGHQWVKARYIDPAPAGWKLLWEEFENPFTGEKVRKSRVFIPSKLSDNHYLGSSYVANLYQSGSEALVKAWLAGDWSVIEGAFFDCWESARHVVKPFEIPEHWLRYRSFDWGFAAPFSVGWWAVASEAVHIGGVTIPRGAIIRYREWYGASAPNVGVRMEAEQIAEGILGREKKGETSFGVADTAIFSQEGRAYGYTGPTIAERMAKAGVIWRPADKSRNQGWDQMRGRLRGDGDGNPMLVVFDTCADFIRTVPVLQHDQMKPEDVDTDSEDHIGDEARYGCMARPWVRAAPQPERPIVDITPPTLHQVVERSRIAKARVGGRI